MRTRLAFVFAALALMFSEATLITVVSSSCTPAEIHAVETIVHEALTDADLACIVEKAVVGNEDPAIADACKIASKLQPAAHIVARSARAAANSKPVLAAYARAALVVGKDGGAE